MSALFDPEDLFVELTQAEKDGDSVVFVSLYWEGLDNDRLTDQTRAVAVALSWLAHDSPIAYPVHERCAYVGLVIRAPADLPNIVERCRKMKRALLNGDHDRLSVTESDSRYGSRG
ncbi:hypothetical protein [Rhodococcus sp. T7]|uniref:hypothetical protein n=1 Tax=Rhodococcus sp. T7 TaxID=627444 RepID=UPI0013590B84|nr:hypothetical protein [Rhodococcus sp. T7]KAF0958460.1 hypothetical protein MLGJGCBP_08439 [Rhodococcus sp. T7]